uniref:Uncharacterized protein n=1 Tax=Siphoviridae sp. ctXfh4 TaxID=2827887 RepID=A0A8S5SGJ6_9CAUD|nr:MAG TPA: hypothetical protein [Siphoviridae sp. ctXfh4]
MKGSNRGRYGLVLPYTLGDYSTGLSCRDL